jgi:hypothetical protein
MYIYRFMEQISTSFLNDWLQSFPMVISFKSRDEHEYEWGLPYKVGAIETRHAYVSNSDLISCAIQQQHIDILTKSKA